MTEHVKTLPERPGTRSAEGRIEINAPAERVWRALTEAGELERWFPLDAKVTPGPNGSIWMSWRNEFAGDMKIRIWDPPHHLQTAWTFHEGDQTAQVTDYLIEGKGGSTAIRAVTSGFPLDSSWDGWVEGTNRGWAFELRSLKHYLERHAGQPRHVVYARRRVPLSGREAWDRLSGEAAIAPWFREGQEFDLRSGGQRAAIVNDPPDSLCRVSIEPGAPGTGQHELVLWLSAWGDHEGRMAEIRTQWTQLLDRVFPEGSTP